MLTVKFGVVSAQQCSRSPSLSRKTLLRGVREKTQELVDNSVTGEKEEYERLCSEATSQPAARRL